MFSLAKETGRLACFFPFVEIGIGIGLGVDLSPC
jgi:hypothetical protein